MSRNSDPLLRLECLDWDTEFFGFPVGKLVSASGPISVHQVRTLMQDKGFRLVYWDSDKSHESFAEHHVVDQARWLGVAEHILNQTASSAGIQACTADSSPEGIVHLALQAGWSSRFQLDKRFTESQFKSLYETWIARSCRREIADEIFTIKDGDLVTGFVTVVHRESASQIGLIAVDANYRRRGIGSQLVSAAAKCALEHGNQSLCVVTQCCNKAAMRLYETAGFEKSDVRHWYHVWDK